MMWNLIERAYNDITWLVVVSLLLAVGWVGFTVLMLLIALIWTALRAITP